MRQEPGPVPTSRRAAPVDAEDVHWWHRITIPSGLLISSLVVAAMLLLSGLLAYQASTTAREAILAASEDSAQRISLIISERVRRIVDPADAIIRQLAFDPITSATTLPSRMRRLPVLARVLEQNALLSAVFIGYPDGQFLLVRPLRDPALRQRLGAPDTAAFLVQSMSRERGAADLVGRWGFYSAQLRPVASVVRPDYRYDPRTRPWYQEALEQNGQILTAPYLFFTTREVGVTLSQPSEDGRAILGLDVALPDLGREIESLRLIPDTEIVVVDRDQRVLAYPDMSRVLESGDGPSLNLRTLDSLGIPSLSEVHRLDIQPGESRRFTVHGREWLGQVQPLQSLRWRDLNILMAVPTSELLSGIDESLRRHAWVAASSILFMVFLGALAGRRVGRSLSILAAQAEALARFDFRRFERPRSYVREMRDLGRVMDSMSETIAKFLDITHHISAESRLDLMLSSVLYELVRTTHCSSGAVYLVAGDGKGLERIARYCEDPEEHVHYPDRLPMAHFINHADALDGDQDGRGGDGGRRHPLRVQLRTRDGQPLGVLSLRYMSDYRMDDANFRVFVEKLSGTLSVAIETRNLIEGQKRLFDAMIRLLADAIDAKSPYTGGHCERVPQLAEMLMQRLCEAREGAFAAVRMTEAEREEFRLGAWLHDCGKVTSPEHVIDKATKLEILYNRIHEVRMRFEVLWRDAEISYWQQREAGIDADGLGAHLRAQQARLQEEFAFVARCNVGGEAMADADIARLAAIGAQPWQRHFDHRLGLSSAELDRLGASGTGPLPATERLLADRPDHIVPWGERRPPVERDNPANRWGFDMVLPAQAAHLGELHNLSVRRGTLTEEDRFKINEHIVQTIIMLSSLPFPPHLARVPDIAGTHHEKMDGTGYPRGLTGEQLTLADRVMALADIFEALTAADRPYKPAKTLSESLAIMATMARQQHIDAEVFRFFLRSGVWREYAERFLSPLQRDTVDVEALEGALG